MSTFVKLLLKNAYKLSSGLLVVALLALLSACASSPDDLPDGARKRFKAIDKNGDERITYSEFRDHYRRKPEIGVRKRFDRYDKNGDGIVTVDEVQETL